MMRGPVAWFVIWGMNWTLQASRIGLCLCTLNRFTGIMWPLRHKTVRS